MLWSPMGDRVAYVLSREIRQDADGNASLLTSDLWLVDPTGATATMLVTALGSRPIEALGFSPDGDRILFSKNEEAGSSEASGSLWSVNKDGTGARMLVADVDVGAWVALPADAEGASTP